MSSGVSRGFSGCPEPPPPTMIFLFRGVTPLLAPTLTSNLHLRLLETSLETNSGYATDVNVSLIFNSIQFSLFPAHVNISYNNDNVHIMCMKSGGLKTVLMNVSPLTLTVVKYEHNYNLL